MYLIILSHPRLLPDKQQMFSDVVVVVGGARGLSTDSAKRPLCFNPDGMQLAGYLLPGAR